MIKDNRSRQHKTCQLLHEEKPLMTVYCTIKAQQSSPGLKTIKSRDLYAVQITAI